MGHATALRGQKRQAWRSMVVVVAVVIGLLVAWPAPALAASGMHAASHAAAADGAATVSGPSSAPTSRTPAVSSQQKAWIIGGIVAIGAVVAGVAAAGAAVAARRSGRPRGRRWWR
jgi:hypothetical protein